MTTTSNDAVQVGIGVLVQRGGRVLLGRRQGSHGAGDWALPGGHLDFGETIEACAARELAEETGLAAARFERGPYTSDVFATPRRHYLTLFVLARGVDGEPQLREPHKCEGWQWFDWDALPQPLFAPLASLVASGWRPPPLPDTAPDMPPDTPLQWSDRLDDVDWAELSALYRAAPLGNKSPDWLREAFTNSRIRCFVRDGGRLVGAGRALSDGVDCAYLCDIAVMPSHQGSGLGKQLVGTLVERAKGHRKIILYAVPGREPFYRKFGFRRMRTAMAIFDDPAAAFERGYLDDER